MKGPNAPPAPTAGMMWWDDDTPSATIWTLKAYDGADWAELGRLNVTTNVFTPADGNIAWADVASAATTNLSATSSNVRITGTTTITSFGTADSGLMRNLRFAAALTLTHNASSLILPGGANITTAAGDTAVAMSLGSGNWLVFNFTRAAAGYAGNILLANPVAAANIGINRGTEQATTSGTAIDFTGIPAGVRRITALLSGVSTNGAANLALRLGTSGGIVATGYSGIFGYWGTVSAAYGALSASFNLTNGSAPDTTTGRFVLENISGNNWLASFTGSVSSGGNIWVSYCSGVIALGGVLDRLRLTTDTGTPTFDAGAINIMWEF